MSFQDRGMGLVIDETPAELRYGVFLKDVVDIPAPGADTVSHNRDLWLPKAWDQKQSNQCVGFSGARAQSMALVSALSKGTDVPPDPEQILEFSPTFGWWNAKDPQDKALNVGVTITEYVRKAVSYGQPLREAYPFETEPGNWRQRLAQRPDPAAYENAARHQLLKGYRLDDGDVNGIVAALSAGHPVQFGFPVYSSYDDTGSDGVVKPFAGAFRGYHAEVLWDVDRIGAGRRVASLNSWSEAFGKDGWCFFSEEQMARFSDVWVYVLQEVT